MNLLKLLNIFNKYKYFSFVKNSYDIKNTQLNILESILNENIGKNQSYEEFKTQNLVCDYSKYRERIEDEKENFCENFVRFQATSGSTDSIKWIPFNSSIIQEFDWASSPWIADLALQYPEIMKGKHYWSLSWVPQHLRDKLNNDDSELMPFWKSFLMSKIMAVDSKVTNAKTSFETMFQTCIQLLNCPELTLISVWSPTFLLNLVDFIFKNKDQLVKELIKKNLSVSHLEINDVGLFTKTVWPNLKVISCWDTSSSRIWISKINTYFPHASVQGKGVWATEAVLTIPFKNKYPLAYKSHFYEFEVQSTGDVIPSWQLKKDMIVSPIVTTGNGFFRYKIEDLLIVEDFYNSVPCLKFLGRKNTIDLVGEKIDSSLASKILDKFDGMSLLALKKEKLSYYALIVDKNFLGESIEDEDIESELCQIYHYKLARELGQLDKAKLIKLDCPIETYYKLFSNEYEMIGNVKVEPLKLVEAKESIKLLESLNV